MNKAILIFSGYNNRAIISFLRVLDEKKINYIIIAKSYEDEILNTKYKKNVIHVRDSLDLVGELFEHYFELAFNHGKYDQLFIAPSTESLIRFLLPYKCRLKEKNILLPVVDQELYELISDKHSFGYLCEKEGINVPNEILSYENLNFPIVAKPKNYKNGVLRPIIVENQMEFNNISNMEGYYFQEYINGRSIYLLYYFDAEGKVNKLSQENLLQQPKGKSILAAKLSDFHNSSISERFEKLFLKYKFRGLIMVEVKLYEDKFFMIEANPRMWGPSQLFLNAHVNLFENLLLDYNVISKDEINDSEFNMNAKYFWFKGLLEVLQNGEAPISYNEGLLEVFNDFKEWLKVDVYNGEDILSKEKF